MDIDQRIYTIVHATTLNQGLELVELKVGRHNKDTMIQVFADKPKGGIGLEECTALNRSIVENIDKEGFLGDDGYSLEVSSPGLDRPLITYKDFLRNINGEIRLWLKQKVEGKVEYKGFIKSVSEQELVLSTTTKDLKEINIPINAVLKAILVV